MQSLTDVVPPYQRQDLPLASNRRNTASTAAFFASMISHLRPSTYRLPYRPKPPFRYCFSHLSLLLPHPYLWPHSLTSASLPPLYPPPHITSPTAMHMRYVHHRFHRL
jgi:hypothetical protein